MPRVPEQCKSDYLKSPFPSGSLIGYMEPDFHSSTTPESYRESSDDKSHINTNFMSNYCHNKQTNKKHHPVARAHSVHNMRKAENHLLNFTSS